MASLREIARFMDSVDSARSLRTLGEQHRWAPGGSPPSLRDIATRHAGEDRVIQRFMFLNTFLMDIKIDNIRIDAGAGTKPAVDARAREIGAFIRDMVDIAGLAEVWKEEEKHILLNQWPDDRRPFHEEGDIGRFARKSDGLLVLSQDLPLMSDKERHEFIFASGHDARVDKAVMQVRLDVGMGPSVLELYITHFQAGDRNIQLSQAIETAVFISRTHNPRNPAILAGDFNIGRHLAETMDRDAGEPPWPELAGEMRRAYRGGDNPFAGIPVQLSPGLREDLVEFLDGMLAEDSRALTEYEVLSSALGRVGFRDLWELRNGHPGYTSHMDHSAVADEICPPGELMTSRRDDGSGSEGDGGTRFCDDLSVPRDPPFVFQDGGKEKKSDRIDHIFVSRPSADSSFTLDFTRPRRLRLERDRDAPKRRKIRFMSDHVALETTLLLAPRSR